MKRDKRLVYLVQQGVWESPLEAMPLAMGYLKSTALADDRIRQEAEVEIRNYHGGKTLTDIANDLFRGGAPDILAFSVLGWNFRTFGALAETFKQLNPDGWVVFGGTHVAHQGERVFRMFPDVDAVVDGEGEFVFRDIVHAYLDRDESKRALGLKDVAAVSLRDITGLTYREPDGTVVKNPERARIQNLDEIPSPFLTGALPMTDDHGRFRYDVALMETNRGCPYKCAFCYWGGAIGQKVRAFSRERLREELELMAKLQVHTVVLCDANFGMLPADLGFIEDLIEFRDRYGFPRALETSWAKNKSKTFYEIVSRMKSAGMRSSFTLALQTLNDETLNLMNRKNMKVNAWEDLAEWLAKEGFDLYAELIWGAPGETIESFMEGYDRLARRVSRIACYPMLMLPNTEYTTKKAEYGIISVRGDNDDFEYMLANNTVTFEQNEQMQRFLYWARVVGEMCVLQVTFVGLRELAGIKQSEVLRSLGAFIEEVDDPAAEPLRAAMESAIAGAGDLAAGVGRFYTDPEAKRLLRLWWQERIRPELPEAVAPVLDEIFHYDLLTHPIYQPKELIPVSSVRGEDYYVRKGVHLSYDVPTIIATLRADGEPDLSPTPITLNLYYRIGSETAVYSTNHEVIVLYRGIPEREVLANAAVLDAAYGAGDELPAAA